MRMGRSASSAVGSRNYHQPMTSEMTQARAELTRAGFRLLNSVVEPVVRAGAANPLPIGPGVVVLETTGRVSGKTRRVPLVASRLCDRLVVSSVRDNSQWIKNVEADPAVTVWLFGTPRAALATVYRGPLTMVILEMNANHEAASAA